jgi:hypothetical protein
MRGGGVCVRDIAFDKHPCAARSLCLEMSRGGAAAAGFPDFGGPRAVDLQFGHFAEALGEAFQQLSVERRLGGSKGVVAPEARLADHDEVGLTQVGQMPRDAWLRGLQDLDDVADAEFSTLQDVEYPQPSSVGKCSEHQIDAVEHFGLCRFGHIKSWKLVLAYHAAQGPLSPSAIA